MRAGTLSIQRRSICRKVLGRGRWWSGHKGNQRAGIVVEIAIPLVDAKASASFQKHDPFSDVLFVEQAAGSELLNPASSRTGQTNEISVFVDLTGQGVVGLDDGAGNPT